MTQGGRLLVSGKDLSLGAFWAQNSEVQTLRAVSAGHSQTPLTATLALLLISVRLGMQVARTLAYCTAPVADKHDLRSTALMAEVSKSQ